MKRKNPMAAMAAAMGLCGGGDTHNWIMQPVGGAERAKLAKTFQHLPLNVGDKVRWKDGMKNRRGPGKAQTVEVFRVLTPPVPSTSNDGTQKDCEVYDFTVMFRDPNDGELAEFHFDSRRFELVRE